MPVDAEIIMQNKRTVRGRIWFVVDDEIVRVDFNDAEPLPAIPSDGCMCHRVQFADGTGDNGNSNGWLVFGRNSKGRIICQFTAESDEPSKERYPNCKFSRCKITDSALLHVVAEEARQWR